VCGRGVRTPDDHELCERVAGHCSAGEAEGWLCGAVRVVLECPEKWYGVVGRKVLAYRLRLARSRTN
jgi:hypothetical protein